MQINPENYKSRPPLPEDVPLAHTDSSVHLTSFVLHFGSNEPLDLWLIAVVSCMQVLQLVGWRRTSVTGRQMSRPLIREGPGSGGAPLLVAVNGEYKLPLPGDLWLVFDGFSPS